MSEWERVEFGQYKRVNGPAMALVFLEGEIWCTRVYWKTLEVDRGEWDSRSVAFRNASAAMRRAHDLRAPLHYAARLEREEGQDE